MKVLEVENLKTWFHTSAGIAKAVDGVSFSIEEGSCLGIVGESGCGKSVTAMSIMRLLSPPQAFHPDGKILLDDTDVLKLDESDLQSVRGNKMGMIFQEPMTALNPVYTIEDQIREPLLKHLGIDKEEAHSRVKEVLKNMGMAYPEVIMNSYPHQLSGGMRQRIVIAIAMTCKPKLLICDEPTTALDVTIQAQILNLIKDLQHKTGTSIILITHDLGVVNQMSEQVMVMYSGKVAEYGTRNQIIKGPKHPYTFKLMESIPRSGNKNKLLPVIPGMVRQATDFPKIGCRFAERCDYCHERCKKEDPLIYDVGEEQKVSCFMLEKESSYKTNHITQPTIEVSKSTGNNLIKVNNLKTHFPIRAGFFKKIVGHVPAVDDVAVDIPEGVTLAVVGESGCGKSTLGQSILRLIPEAQGGVYFDGNNLLELSSKEVRDTRKSLQIIFQDPYGSLNPRLTIRQIIGEGLKIHHPEDTPEETQKKINLALEEVGLPANVAYRYPHEFSGGQAQRIAVARALAADAKILILDEPVSALDVSVQAQVLNLLADLKAQLGLTYLFISHDLAVVEAVSDRVAVLYFGSVVEIGEASDVFRAPRHPYTKLLADSAPVVGRKLAAPESSETDLPDPLNPPQGCAFAARCPLASDLCRSNVPRLDKNGGALVACHHPLG